jgi:hypothetical protein
MKWNGDPDVLIDRFDGRNQLDYLDQYIPDRDKEE